MQGIKLDAQLCRQCRGRCCQGHPGVWSEPKRFFAIFSARQIPTADQLAKIMRRQALELRDIGGVLIPAPRSTERGCSALGKNGCAFTAEQRPCQCLALTPNLETLLDDEIHCSLPPEYGSNSARENWRPLQQLIGQVRSALETQPRR